MRCRFIYICVTLGLGFPKKKTHHKNRRSLIGDIYSWLELRVTSTLQWCDSLVFPPHEICFILLNFQLINEPYIYRSIDRSGNRSQQACQRLGWYSMPTWHLAVRFSDERTPFTHSDRGGKTTVIMCNEVFPFIRADNRHHQHTKKPRSLSKWSTKTRKKETKDEQQKKKIINELNFTHFE